MTKRSLVLVPTFVFLLAASCSRHSDKPAIDTTNVRVTNTAAPVKASIDCGTAAGAVEQLVCGDPTLAALDQKLGTVYSDAQAKQPKPTPSGFADQQRSWNGVRDACGATKACLDTAYIKRIASLQATAMLVPTKGPITYACTSPAAEHEDVTATYADTDPATAIIERGDQTVVAYFVKSPSGPRYEGPGVSFADRSGKVQITWQGVTLKCHEQAQTS